MGVTRRHFGLSLIGAGALIALSGGLAGVALAADTDGPPNVFISPCGQPFRAKLSAPYPIVDWFKQADKNNDGRLDRAEFMADTEAFFKMLDINDDGVISPYEVSIYEQRVAPEVLGYRVEISAVRPRLWLAQTDGMSIDPGGAAAQDDSDAPKPKVHLDESGQGASPYSLFNEPEPVSAANLDFNGLIRLRNFLKLADGHFTALDKEERGYLTLDKLPKTPVQEKVELWLQQHRPHS